ncbi:MAG: hypothetical protein LC620_00770 [Halobacteriales archaeon]|nr:hypothetical protein [Halobacteriales archaeon]
MRTPTACLVLAALLAAPAQAFPIGAQDYAANVHFAGGVEGLAKGTFLSGQMEAGVARASGPFVLFNVTGFAVTGITRACWAGARPDCMAGNVRLELSDGGAVGLDFPGPAYANLTSRHSLAFFVDVGKTLDFTGVRVDVGRDLAAVHVGGEMAFTRLPDMPATASPPDMTANAAGLVLLDARATVRLTAGAATQTLAGDSLVLTFQGAPAIAPFAVGASVVPFPSGAEARFAPADTDAARQGIDLQRVSSLSSQLTGALGGEPSDPQPQEPDAIGTQLQPLLGAILGGALLMPPQGATSVGSSLGNLTGLLHGTTFLRFEDLSARSLDNGTVDLAGSGPLEIQGGHVVGAPSLAGVMPWWCWLLWVAALGMWIARLVLKPAKDNERWDQYKWVGWVVGPIVTILVFWLWDTQVHAVWGLSLLRGGSGGAGLAFLALTEVVIGLLVYFAVVTPLSSLLKSGFRFAGLGRFMRLNRPIAMLLGFLMGATLLLSYVDLLIGLLG